ncbi:hypothetical protein SERLA73DRAFT_180937 [Serpula lacrymans var. lacrymans S7.3]|uniref:DUF1690 domain-containing protein n=2 Tax=Serpula lacrymans var. lacrymans TaxID=341189 RepID=F8PWN8_SERL3|nr:uncharacterized protein SERLADRAFT_466764 [Serpula lacrymans var. lacrymans S7.9]EGO00362.1 hypothetical protein SERLA73DRAFT_180937 [Serpula lacrymans var. lacrymans S7.3]EGO25923.1 hypothetical protein SERLADRAFT_466764 [Serpula lacrymans var. lacrymans S7.9]
MGAGQSKPESDDNEYRHETPIQFSQDVVNHLADRVNLPETTPERQTTLDAHIRSRIQADLKQLRTEEENVQREIEVALEKENLDRERSMAGDTEEEAHGDIKSSTSLMNDIEEIRSKVDRTQTRQQLGDLFEVNEKSQAVASCYQSNPTTPLNCWREVASFKMSVARAETQYFESLR